MIRLVEKRIQSIQFNDITMKFLSEYYMDKCNQEIILMIYDGDEYFTNIGYEEMRLMCEDKELIHFLVAYARDKSIDDGLYVKKEAETIFKNNCYIKYVLVKNDNSYDKKAIFYSDVILVKESYKENLITLKQILKKEGIYAYFVKIPEISDIEKKVQHPEWRIENFSAQINWTKSRESEVKRYLCKFTDLEYDDAKTQILNKEPIKSYIGEHEDRTIFLVGPCIIGGWESLPGEELCNILYKSLRRLNLNYKIINVVIGRIPDLNNSIILEYDIRQNDIVLFVEDVIDKEEVDINLDYIYNNYKGSKWLYSDVPIHTTRLGNELISNEIIKSIIKPIADISEEKFDNNILHRGEKQLTYEESAALEQYLKDIKEYSDNVYGVVGACVMTCNPFTKGHYHLIEYASKQVDFLYVFIVEEDAVFFPFEDRIEMVRRGVRNLKNVVVLPSGSFMISKTTFRNYFEKEIHQDIVIDAAKDTMIFGKYIAPALRISKRFIGEEPDDNITSQYNQSLKKDLSEIVEIVEIPRKKTCGEIISASKVRRYLEERNWNAIEKMVPDTTLEYLKGNVERFLKKRIRIDEKKLKQTVEFIQSHDRIVFCGLGDDGQTVIQRLKESLSLEDFKKLEFYDKKATQLNFSYEGKKVICFEELINKYKEYYMLIATRKFQKEIFYSLIDNKVDPKHIMVALL